MYVYIQSEPSLWTVGFYDPSGKFQPESDHDSREGAAKRVNYLNGGKIPDDTLAKTNEKIEKLLDLLAPDIEAKEKVINHEPRLIELLGTYREIRPK